MMDEINDDFINVDVSIIIGANDIVIHLRRQQSYCRYACFRVLEGKTAVRSRAWQLICRRPNPYSKDNTRMLFGDAKKTMDEVLVIFNQHNHNEKENTKN